VYLTIIFSQYQQKFRKLIELLFREIITMHLQFKRAAILIPNQKCSKEKYTNYFYIFYLNLNNVILLEIHNFNEIQKIFVQ